MQIVVATHNEGKLVEIRRILEEDLGADAENIELVSAGSLHLPDPVETGVTFQENALLKARAVAIRTGLPAVADDSGLIVDVMGNAPGILSARWAGAHGHDKANNALLLAQIEDIPDDKRTARFRCAAALVVPDTEIPGRDTLYGRLDFLQLVGITQRELDVLRQDPSQAPVLAQRLGADDPWLLTDLDRTRDYL